jgi:hypothetical protein
LLEHYLKRLKLPTMLREYTSMAVVCRDDRADYPTYLLRLTERELLDRETRAIYPLTIWLARHKRVD